MSARQPVCQSKCVTGRGITLILFAWFSGVYNRVNENYVLKFLVYSRKHIDSRAVKTPVDLFRVYSGG